MENMFSQSESTPQETRSESSPSPTPLELRKDEIIYDDAFVVRESRYGCFSSTTLEGRRMLTGGTLKGVVEMTRWHLKCEQEGWPEGSVRVVGSAIVGGKL